ncbi:hypothetical protein Syun_004507 [Stephania yunnanensis]|uniref:Uncharacterized protein n=1 Tax=Stephania yunnanensis TaxID=152371 RepID=A0AAP0L5P7_9MAGN
MKETTATRRRDPRVTATPEIPERLAESETERRELRAKNETDLGVLDRTIERDLRIFGDDRTRRILGRGRSLGLEVLAQSRGDLRLDPRFDAVNVIALVIQEDDNDILDSFVLLRGDVAESCESNGIFNYASKTYFKILRYYLPAILNSIPDNMENGAVPERVG